jgi:alkyl sulfatase BDS1-like metallo-beta-lactamase superfamily hydrolase
MTFNFIFDDMRETHVVELENAVLHHRQADPVPDADATVHLTRELLVKLGAGEAGLKDLIMSDDLKVEGSRLKLLSFLSLVSKPDGQFPIVTP